MKALFWTWGNFSDFYFDVFLLNFQENFKLEQNSLFYFDGVTFGRKCSSRSNLLFKKQEKITFPHHENATNSIKTFSNQQKNDSKKLGQSNEINLNLFFFNKLGKIFW